MINDANTVVQLHAPWKYKYEDEIECQDIIIKDVAEVARVVSLVLQPFIPEISDKMLDRLAVSNASRTSKYAMYGADLTYGKGINRKGDPPITELHKRSL